MKPDTIAIYNNLIDRIIHNYAHPQRSFNESFYTYKKDNHVLILDQGTNAKVFNVIYCHLASNHPIGLLDNNTFRTASPVGIPYPRISCNETSYLRNNYCFCSECLPEKDTMECKIFNTTDSSLDSYYLINSKRLTLFYRNNSIYSKIYSKIYFELFKEIMLYPLDREIYNKEPVVYNRERKSICQICGGYICNSTYHHYNCVPILQIYYWNKIAPALITCLYHLDIIPEIKTIIAKYITS